MDAAKITPRPSSVTLDINKGEAMKKGIVIVNGGIHSTTTLAVAKGE